MDIKEILSYVDHTLLSPSATWDEVKEIIDEGITFKTASVCIPPSFVKRAKEYAGEKVRVCTVIGFPNGYNTTFTKVAETKDAIANGADEIDMVINIGNLRSLNYHLVESEIKEIKKACGNRILKVIIETSLLSKEEKIKMCEIITSAKADFIKTSTGFSTGGATRDDIMLFKEHIGKEVKIKASGGIRTIKDAEDYISLGCQRLGTSSIIRLAKEIK